MEEISAVSNINAEYIYFSRRALVISADYVVKSVIIILIIASLYSWSIIVAKLLRLRQLKQMEKEFEEIFWSGNSFEDLYETLNFNKLDPKSKIFCSAISEWKKSKSNLNSEIDTNISSLKDRMQRSMIISFNKESEILEKNLTFLATSGSTAPFIGLFGTVWGIMNSFKSIAVAQNTNLSVVAYNKISSDLSKYFVSLETFMDEFTTIFFRQLEKKTIDKY